MGATKWRVNWNDILRVVVLEVNYVSDYTSIA
jgi:hypothetical protein